MGKNKFFKKLIVAGLCALTATATFGVTACGGDNNDGGSDKHTCNFATAWSSDKDGHWHVCLNAGHTEAYTKIEHVDENKDNKCDACQYVLTASGDETGGETQTKKPVVVDFTEDTTANGAIAADLGITATSAIAVKDQKRKIIYKGKETAFEKGLKMNGEAKKTEKSFKVNLPEDATVIVYAASGSGMTNTYLAMLDSEGKVIDGTKQQVSFNEATSSAYAYPAIFRVKANTEYYIGGYKSNKDDANAVVFRIAVVYGTFTEDKGELVPAVSATCATDGNIAYYLTEYGRYLNESGAVVGPKEALKTATGHDYVQDGEPSVYPTQTTAGKVKIKCQNDAAHVADLVLPALETNGAYTRTANAEDSSKTDYIYVNETYKVGIMFTADTVPEKVETVTSYTVDFTDITKFTAEAGATKVVLGAAGDGTNTGTNTEIKYVDGKKTGLTVVRTKKDAKEVSVASNTAGENTYTALTFGGTMAKDKNAISFAVPVKGTVTITVKYFSANAGRYVQVMDTEGKSLATTDTAAAGKVVINGGAITDGKTEADPADSEGKKSTGKLVTATITINVANADTTLLLGSAANGIWITYLDIQWTAAE